MTDQGRRAEVKHRKEEALTSAYYLFTGYIEAIGNLSQSEISDESKRERLRAIVGLLKIDLDELEERL